MKKILQYLFEHKTLSREQAKDVLVNIGKGIYNEHEITAFMTAYLMRSITIDELQGFRDALLELCVPVDFTELIFIKLLLERSQVKVAKKGQRNSKRHTLFYFFRL